MFSTHNEIEKIGLIKCKKDFFIVPPKIWKLKKTKGYGEKRIQYSQLMFMAKCIFFLYVHVC